MVVEYRSSLDVGNGVVVVVVDDDDDGSGVDKGTGFFCG